jgi:hypothetical protein
VPIDLQPVLFDTQLKLTRACFQRHLAARVRG